MNYTEQLLAKKAAGMGKRVTSEIHQWKDAGEVVAGKLVKTEPFTKGKFEGEVLSYLIDTGESLVATVIGAHTDEQIKGTFEPGDFLMIEFQGKKSISDGKRANIFTVTVFKAADMEFIEPLVSRIAESTASSKKGNKKDAK
jgi:hypothetical protein